MAKFEMTVNQDFESLTRRITDGILEGSISASIEDSSEFYRGDTRCAVWVFERYSYMGGNRVSLSVTLFGPDQGPVQLSAITSGGSRAVFSKVNTIGEESFLEELRAILEP